MMEYALKARRVFTGEQMLNDHAVIVDNRMITDVMPSDALARGLPVTDLGDSLLAPGFIDVQVNGGGGVNLNEKPEPHAVLQMAAAHRTFGTTGMLPTVITDTVEIQAAAAVAVATARQSDRAILGIHVEGPFLDPARKGAHDPALIRPMTAKDEAWLSSLDCGKVLITVAPNRVSAQQIAKLARAEILVSLGHSEATAEVANAALAAGATGFTHIFNAMSQIGPREPGMAGAAMMSPHAYAGLIADGFHVHPDVIQLLLAAKPLDRIMLVTDAMSTAAGGPDHFALQGRKVTLRSGRLELDDGTLAGSNLTMDEAVRYSIHHCGVSVEAALCMASANPVRFLGLGNRLGFIKPGYLASMVALDENLRVTQTWVEGR